MTRQSRVAEAPTEVPIGRALVALASFLGGREPADASEAAALARGAAALPVVGAAAGALAGWLGGLAGAEIAPEVGAAISVLVLTASGGGRFLRDLGGLTGRASGMEALARLVPALMFAAEAMALLEMPPALLPVALVLAGVLGRWAWVVQAYGSLVPAGHPRAAALVRGLEFREFALASVSAMALALIFASALGLLALMLVAALAITLRIAAHRVQGGVTLDTLGAGAALAEGAPLAFLAGLAHLLGAS